MNMRCKGVAALVIFAACQLLSPAVAHAGVVSQSIPIEGAEQIEINVPIALHVEQGDHESLTLSADERDMNDLRVRQDAALLSIDRSGPSRIQFSHDAKIHATLVLKKMTALHLNAAGTVSMAAFRADRIEFTIGGAGSMDLKGLTADKVELSIEGAGEIDASGVADSVSVHVSGIGSAELEGLATKNSHVMISGGGSVKVAASEDLDASISGVGQVRYLGTPHVFKAISGIGTVEPLNS